MPELPEVETVVRELRPSLVSRRLAAVHASRKRLRLPWSRSWNALVANRRVLTVDRRGKWILIRLEGEHFLALHLGMSGQLTVTPAALPRASHTHLVFPLDDGASQLRFRDIRRFGSARLFAGHERVQQFFAAAGLGPEPFELHADYWREQLQRTQRRLKAVLLDQRVVAGVGNIYADESLFEARLHPARIASTIRPEESDRLRRAIVTVLNRAIRRRGSTINDYIGVTGKKGAYQNEFRVYGRTDLPCRKCRTAIVCIRLAGRSTHFCPRCQRGKMPR